jgi:hypothetical protein
MNPTIKQRFVESMMQGHDFDPGVEAMTKEARQRLLPAGDEIEEVMTKTLDVLARNPAVQVRDLDADKVRVLIKRLTFFEEAAAVHLTLAKMLRDQELILEDQLQREANNINKEIKRYVERDAVLAAEFSALSAYMGRANKGRKRNSALIDKALQALDSAREDDAPGA